LAGIWLPANTSVIEDLEDHAAQRTSEGLDAITCLPIGGFAKTVNDLDHAFAIEYARDVVSDGRCDLAAPARRQLSENQGGHLAADISESVAVEKEERSPAVTLPEEFDGLF
jgi:hypothetical protein